jgi:hypothetical protein
VDLAHSSSLHYSRWRNERLGPQGVSAELGGLRLSSLTSLIFAGVAIHRLRRPSHQRSCSFRRCGHVSTLPIVAFRCQLTLGALGLSARARRQKGLLGKAVLLFLVGGLFLSALVTSAIALASIYNYPGGEAMAFLHRHLSDVGSPGMFVFESRSDR